tara:strand:+ start:1347 stop:1658 length:312 start_codon:yes stop_codon:yes gene_type:complete
MNWKEVLKGSCGTQREKQQFEKTGKAKPDYIDIDGDGNKTEPMKEAAKDAKMKKSMEDDAYDTFREATRFAKQQWALGKSKKQILEALKKKGWEAFDLSFLED